ncbi:MAG: hypothetical protein HOD10_05485 [Candidatus Marinimicrobia bacterium]|jgi:hypothetical protein|nr:hypothetical protein [Candidatus Neomarinimicrobiota bacterium]MBT3762451.1 hypothetical protein [Candidatus Neomarinimicrobiota bacterium]MBT4372228.1 hypothetical protein [Candidatus Neomarinimicrobiota bacterium]MBT4809321.1 hypothetical protein [Candidatus Neomarinimicrobiota bacterium]MBT5175174.1 hypothetical protein [Candidatus Neomarinimicrobiota bacterium]
MKFHINQLIFLTIITSFVFAQRPMGGDSPEPIDWVKKLDLSEDQAKQMDQIQKKFRDEITVMRENRSGDPMQMMGRMQEKQKQRDKAVKKVLSKKQNKKYKKELKSQQKDRRKRMGNKRQGQGRKGGGQGRRRN